MTSKKLENDHVGKSEGFPYYLPKPVYYLVERGAKGGGPARSTYALEVGSAADQEHRYAVGMKEGYITSDEIAVSQAGGLMSSLSLKSNPALAEVLPAVAMLIAKVSVAAATGAPQSAKKDRDSLEALESAVKAASTAAETAKGDLKGKGSWKAYQKAKKATAAAKKEFVRRKADFDTLTGVAGAKSMPLDLARVAAAKQLANARHVSAVATEREETTLAALKKHQKAAHGSYAKAKKAVEELKVLRKSFVEGRQSLEAALHSRDTGIIQKWIVDRGKFVAKVPAKYPAVAGAIRREVVLELAAARASVWQNLPAGDQETRRIPIHGVFELPAARIEMEKALGSLRAALTDSKPGEAEARAIVIISSEPIDLDRINGPQKSKKLQLPKTN